MQANSAAPATVSSCDKRRRSRPWWRHHARNPALNASPAPIVSTTSTRGAGIATLPCAVTAWAPSAPRVISTSAGPRPSSCPNYDGVGFSYSANALAAQGISPGAAVKADGLTFTWPNVTACAADNILAGGQTMLVQGKSGAKTLGLLGSSTNGSSQGTITINYTDGTSSTQTVSFDDWASSPGSADTAVATMPYRNSIGGSSQTITMYVFATTVPVDSSKTVASVTFPDVANTVGSGVTAMHIFAMSLG
jgi:hypothetical protein